MKKILVIEDEANTRNLFLECLQAEGYDTIGAEDGLAGVQRALEELPDLVVCDIKMPQLDGYGVLSKLRQNPATAIIPFIFLTGKASKADQRRGMELGADDYLTKPSTVEELLRAISTRLEKRATLHQWYTTQRDLKPLAADKKTFAIRKSLFPSVPHLSEVFNFIEANYQQQITLGDVAQAIGYSRSYLTDLMKNHTGKTVYRWVVERRMAEARCLLLQTNDSVEQIATTVGYQNPCHFFRQFRQHHRETPQAWRKVHQAQLDFN